VHVRELSVPDAYELTPVLHSDDRGAFLEWFKDEPLRAAVGHRLELAQANLSLNRKGSVRGIHFADVPPGQAKYVTCITGAVLDVVVDIRVGSPSYGRWDAVRLDDVDRRAVYLAEGLGHAFMALTDDTAVAYLCSEGYAPAREHGVHPLDPEIGIGWPEDVQPLLSARDTAAPSLSVARDAGLLPAYDDCVSYYQRLTAGPPRA
jgi:dTDP-4-dehydrorhamnose 3,5-epimerase